MRVLHRLPGRHCRCAPAWSPPGRRRARDVVTVEGLRRGGGARRSRGPCTAAPRGDDALDPVQRAFLDAGAVQCGFCTPGLIVAVHDLLARVPRPADPEIREALAGNLCRCTGYEKIMDAVRLAVAGGRRRDPHRELRGRHRGRRRDRVRRRPRRRR